MKNWIWATTRNSKLLLLFAKGLRTHFNKCRLRWRKLTAKLCRLVQEHLPFHLMIVFHKFVNFSGEMFLFSLTLKRCKTIRKLASASVSKTNESRSHVDTQIFHNHNFNFIYTETTIFFFLNPIIFGWPKSWRHQWLSKFKCLVPVGMLPECGSPDWKEIAKSWCLPGHPPTVWHQFWSLHLIWRTCDAALVAAMPYLDYFLLLFFWPAVNYTFAIFCYKR